MGLDGELSRRDSRPKHLDTVQTKLAKVKARFFSPVLHRRLLGGVSSPSVLSAHSSLSLVPMWIILNKTARNQIAE